MSIWHALLKYVVPSKGLITSQVDRSLHFCHRFLLQFPWTNARLKIENKTTGNRKGFSAKFVCCLLASVLWHKETNFSRDSDSLKWNVNAVASSSPVSLHSVFFFCGEKKLYLSKQYILQSPSHLRTDFFQLDAINGVSHGLGWNMFFPSVLY